VAVGFDPNDYPGDGPYFALERALAEDWRKIYQNGLQEFHLPRQVYDALVNRGWIKDDYYTPGRACHVLPGGLAAFHAATRQATPAVYHAQPAASGPP
jgi:hypothetical protein